MTVMTAAPADARIVNFVEPMPGFDDEHSYSLSAIDDQGVLLAMRSTRDPDLRFVLLAPEMIFDDYHPDLGPVVTEALEAQDDVRVLVVLTIGAGLADATANMRAPIVLSPGSGRAMQVVLDDESLPMHRPLASAN